MLCSIGTTGFVLKNSAAPLVMDFVQNSQSPIKNLNSYFKIKKELKKNEEDFLQQ